MKKILSFILAALMTASCAAYVAADDAAVEETTSNAAQDYAIEFLANYGIFKGYSAEDTGAEDLIQRYQMALFVSRISTGWVDDDKWEDGTANNATFKDIDDEPANKYLGALSYANQNGIIEGYTANTFAPYANITYRDALTMVVRTLGYKGLTYPWGYIEKAVELDLTEGIDSDVAYTDDLTRGEVATIIYNAMFANTAKGTTLAKSIFDIDFKWQNIVVVSTDEYTTIYDENDKGQGVYANPGYVGFKTIDSNTAALGDKVYYVKSEDMGLNGHEEERAVGCVFTALFESVDGNYVTMVDVDSAKIATVFNNGITDNDGNPYETMPIAKYLSDNKHATVKEYTDNIVNYEYADLKVFGYEDRVVYDLDGNKTYVGIDFVTKNILKYDETAKKWVVEWLYNDTLEKYYQYTVKAADSSKVSQTVNTANTGDVYINWMSDAEFTEWYNEVIKDAVAKYSELTLLKASATTMLEGKAPYAKLALFDVDNDAKAEVANYKTYGIGMFSTTTAKCYANVGGVNHSAGVDMPAYKLTDLDGGNEKIVFVEEGHIAHDTDKTAGFAWVTVDPSVTTFVNEDGSYVGGVVLYNYNETTGEIEIVKHITANATDDADSYLVTGILQAYNAAKQTVTISGVTYPIDYDNLTGDMYAMANTGVAESARIGAMLDEQYMQYVSAVVCDGYVVDTDLVGADADFIVVLGYAGVTSDGYIAVYGYSTDDATMKVFKINSYNGWKQGDYRYYPTNAAEDEAFQYGSLYQIKSYDAETESYGVYTENVSSALANATPVKITFEDGYRVVEPMNITYKKDGKYYYSTKTDATATVTKMSDKDTYIVVTDADNGKSVNSNIYSYTGKITYNEAFYGLLVNTGVDNKFVIYASSAVTVDGVDSENNSNYLPFFSDNAYQIGYVLYEKANGAVISAAYDEAIAGDYYLLGSTASEVRVLNLLTGNRDTVIASSNIDLVNGHIYKTVGGTILADMTDICNAYDHAFTGAIADTYSSTDLDYATYVVDMLNAMKGSELFVDADKDGKLDTINYLEVAKAMGFVYGTESYATVKAKELVKGMTLYVVGEEGLNWYTGHANTVVDALAAKDVKADYTYVVDFVYEVSTGKLVGYIYNIADKAEGIIAPVDTKTFKSTVYSGGETLGNYTGKKTEWVLETADGKEHIFDIATTYTVVATYMDEDCRGAVESLELTKVEMTLVEMTKDTDGKWTATPVNACGKGNELHDALAALGMIFSGNGEIGVVTVNGEGVKAKNVTISYADCGLVYNVAVDCEVALYDYVDAGDIVVGVEVNETTSVEVGAGNITSKYTFNAHFINKVAGTEADTNVFDGFTTVDAQHIRSKAGDTNGSPAFILSAKEEKKDGIIVLG